MCKQNLEAKGAKGYIIHASFTDLYLLEEFHDMSTIGSADNLEALEARSFGQGLKLLLGSFFASGVVS